MNFSFDRVQFVEFGVGFDEEDQSYCAVSVAREVQNALREMAIETWDAMRNSDGDVRIYEPGEKYAATEYLILPLNNELAERLRALHEIEMLELNNEALAEPSQIVFYFARMRDDQGRRLTALRRATHFKGLLKKHVLRFDTDALRIIPDKVFRLDNDFDLLIDSENIHILRPNSFEAVGQLKEAVLEAVPQNVESIQRDIPFVDFSNIEAYASTHPRAARYLASIRSQRETQGISRQYLVDQCTRTGVEVYDFDGVVRVEDKHILGFLEVLDRRRYEVELVEDAPEQYRAPSRQRLQL